MAKYKTYLFCDNETGEDFAVEVKVTMLTDEQAKEQAIATALEWFPDPEFIDEVDPVEVEMMGIDTY